MSSWLDHGRAAGNPRRQPRLREARPTHRVFSGSRFRRVNHAQQRLRTEYVARVKPKSHQSVQTICLTVGHKESGGSLLGSLLDAHPSMAFAADFDVLDHVAAGFSGYSICYLLARSSRRDARRMVRVEKSARAARARWVKRIEKSTKNEEARLIRQASTREEVTRIEYAARSERDDAEYVASAPTPYSRMIVPGWQRGPTSRVLVVGESNAGGTTRQIELAPHLLPRLERSVHPVKLKLLHLVRSPYELIAIAVTQGGLGITDGIERYFENCAVIDELHQELDNDQIRTVRYENLVRDTVGELRAVCDYLEVDADPGYLDACAAIDHHRPSQARSEIEWSRQDVQTIRQRMIEHRYLENYTHETGAVA